MSLRSCKNVFLFNKKFNSVLVFAGKRAICDSQRSQGLNFKLLIFVGLFFFSSCFPSQFLRSLNAFWSWGWPGNLTHTCAHTYDLQWLDFIFNCFFCCHTCFFFPLLSFFSHFPPLASFLYCYLLHSQWTGFHWQIHVVSRSLGLEYWGWGGVEVSYI